VPDWLEGWESIRADKAGMVFYHLLKLHGNKAWPRQTCQHRANPAAQMGVVAGFSGI